MFSILFKSRYAIVSKKINGESASAPIAQVVLWNETVLPGIIKKFAIKDIFNADETGLFWKLLLDRKLQFKGMDCKGGKHAK